MATGLGVGGDVEQALEGVAVPSYILDTTGIVRWVNAAAERLLGDVRGRHITSVVAPEDSRRARELFTRKVLGTAAATEATGVCSRPPGSGWPWRSARYRSGTVNGWSASSGSWTNGLTTRSGRHTRISPPARWRCCACSSEGRSTKQIAAELHLSTETVRNHIRGLFRALGVNSRLEAVAAARRASPP
jgi:hypothetical protein